MGKYLTVVLIVILAISGRLAEAESLRTTPVVRAVAEALPSVVNIGTERIVSSPYSRWGEKDPFESMFRDFFAEQGAVNTTSLGSGSVIDQSGLIITNSHVVSRATKITVTFDDGSQCTAREIASDDFNDIALLMLENLPDGKKFKPLKFARPEDLLLGETVIAVGNPYGLGNSISQGVLSAKGRKATFEGKVIFSDIMQTDAAINPGNSGGPLINLDGELIGISTAIFKDVQGIGFALPVKRVEDVLAKWLIPERFGDVSLGIIPGQRKNQAGSMDFFVEEIIPDSPAAKSGLKKDDRIFEINGVKPSSLLDISFILWKIQAGGEIRLRISDLKTMAVKSEKIKYAGGLEMAKAKLGLGLQELTRKLAKALEYPFEGGLVVSDLPEGSENVSRGDILVKLGEAPVNNAADIAKALIDKHHGDSVEAIFVSLIKKNGKFYIMKRASVLRVK